MVKVILWGFPCRWSEVLRSSIAALRRRCQRRYSELCGEACRSPSWNSSNALRNWLRSVTRAPISPWSSPSRTWPSTSPPSQVPSRNSQPARSFQILVTYPLYSSAIYSLITIGFYYGFYPMCARPFSVLDYVQCNVKIVILTHRKLIVWLKLKACTERVVRKYFYHANACICACSS